ncbi:hypothetical protein [Methylobacterium sp. WSM2598]|uniref:hypothetical protein n=1 Tax=Methylobacterium sp. WSM2598 TaxID=398261 RepID=UPI0012F65610|nr:hypothetical protein [Methylobacterium sp. WSM2598]
MLPYQISNGQPADASQLMANLNALANCINGAPGGTQNSIQYKDSNGGFAGVPPLANGQLIIGSSNNPPKAASITAGSGIIVSSGPGSVTISSAGGVAVLREFGPYSPPTAASFTYIDGAGASPPTITNVPSVGLVYSVPASSSMQTYRGVYRPIPATAPWTITLRYKYMHSTANWPSFGVWVKDTSGRMLGQVPESGAIIVKRLNSNTNFNSNVYTFAAPDGPQWARVSNDGSSIKFAISWDGQNWINTYSESVTAFLNGNLKWVGLGGLTDFNQTDLWQPGSTLGGVVTYWDAPDDPASSRAAQ